MVQRHQTIIRRLSEEDEVSDFQTEAPVFTRYLKEFARQNQRNHIGTTYVAVSSDNKVLGFATVAVTSIVKELYHLRSLSASRDIPFRPSALPNLQLTAATKEWV